MLLSFKLVKAQTRRFQFSHFIQGFSHGPSDNTLGI